MPEPADAFSCKSPETDIEGAVERNVICVPAAIGNRVKTKLSVLTNTEIRVEETVYASSASDLENVKVIVVNNYSSTAVKRVN